MIFKLFSRLAAKLFNILKNITIFFSNTILRHEKKINFTCINKIFNILKAFGYSIVYIVTYGYGNV